MKNKTGIPVDFTLSPSLKDWLASKKYFFDVDKQIEEFMDYHQARGNKFVDWDAAFRTWVRRGIEMGKIRLEKPRLYVVEKEPEFMPIPDEFKPMLDDLIKKMGI